MARDFEDVFDLHDLNNDELREIVREMLRESRAIDASNIGVHIRDGLVILSGRVGTDEERRIAERVVADRLGLEQVRNNLVVDSLYRAESPENLQEHLAEEAETESLLLGDRAGQEDDEAAHLTLDQDGEENGTVDRMEAMEEGIPWIPPESPTPEGGEGTGTERDGNRDSY